MTLLIIAIDVVELTMVDTRLWFEICYVISTVLFVGVVVCFFLGFGKGTTFNSKWTIVLFLFYLTRFLEAISRGLYWLVGGLAGDVYYTPFDMAIAIVVAVGMLCMILSIGFKALNKLMIVGFASTIVAEFLYMIDDISVISSGKMIVAFLSVLAALLLIVLVFYPKKVVRFFLVLLLVATAILCLINYKLILIWPISIWDVIFWTVLTFLMVPGVKLGLKLSKITAVLCIILAILNITSFFLKTNLSIADTSKAQWEIDMLEREIAILEKQIESKKVDLSKAESDLNNAKNELHKVCSRSSYNMYYCSSKCKTLHNKVTTLSITYTTLSDEISPILIQIDAKEYEISCYERLIEKSTSAVMDIVFGSFAMLMSVSSLILLTICLFRKKFGPLGLVSYSLMMAATLIYVLAGGYNFDVVLHALSYSGLRESIGDILPASPYVIGVIAFSLLAAIIVKKEGKLIRYRVIAIAFSVLMIVVSSESSYSIAFLIYALVMMLTALILVPPVFTEYNNIGKHIFFTFITFGVWQCIWIYNVTKNLNKVESVDRRRSSLELFLCLVLPFYYVYWLYKSAAYVEAYGQQRGKYIKINVLCLALSFVCPLISTVIIQDKINSIVGKPE